MGLRVHVFGPFEYERTGAARVLRKHGIRLKLQGQPLEILDALIEQQGTVVTRQQLQERLWGAETFVDFDLHDAVGCGPLEAQLPQVSVDLDTSPGRAAAS